MDILIIDDDGRCREGLARLLQRAGFDVVAQLEDGADAQAFLEQIRVDLIITDCQMPRMDGLALSRHLRAEGFDVPIIMISGHSDPSMAALARAAGIDAFFTKPLCINDLLQYIRRHCLAAA